MGGAPSKSEPPVVVTSKIPLFCLKKLGPRHIIVAGGGGESKTGVLNLMQTYLLTFENKNLPKAPTPMTGRLVDTIETDVYATMNMDVVCCTNPEKGRYLIAAGHGQNIPEVFQYCDVYETTGYECGRDDADKEVLSFNIRTVGRFTTSEKVESFQKCVRFDRSTAGKRVVTGGEDGRLRVWNARALVEDRMGGAPSKSEPPVVVTSKIPLFCLKKLGPRHIIVAGGGGESKTGVLNLMQTYLLTFENKNLPKAPTPMTGRLVDTIETDVYATMNMDVVCCTNPEKGRYLIAAGHGQNIPEVFQYCDVYETTGYECGRDDADKEVLSFNIRTVGRFTTSEKVESFQKCVRFDRSTAGKRVVTGGEDGRLRVWNARALVEDRNPEKIHKPIVDVKAHDSDVFDIDISPDGRIIISVGHDGIAKLWDMNLGTLIKEVPFPPECAKGYKVRSVRCTSLGTGSNLVFIAGYNPVSLSSKRVSFLALWVFSRERNTIRNIVVRSTGQGDGIASLCVSPCGNYTGMGSMGGSVFIYDTHEMKQLAAFKETHGIFVTAVEFLDRTAADVMSLIKQTSPEKHRFVAGPGSIARASIISLSADQTIQVSVFFRLV
ncbi:WD domain, G-beta repeat protein [Oesophagostomum dentatum]|uniref:WD domain, G-beta repeat protein n=1 Tax=Oesophagostomum dentatum TaxID=61180 RepID=A0A0B1TTD8_OESDE|nr:WD domain, G-beta repeat protein [Oesophagostomum dentatum]